MMIFSRETNAHEEWLEVNVDGRLTYHVENSGWVAARVGLMPRDTILTIDQAKAKWPQHAEKIDAAIARRAS